jgi:diamine N-acetyltransferase
VKVELKEITQDTVRDVCNLNVSPEQTDFVAPNAVSLAEALFTPEAWYRAIYAGESLVGFIMLYDERLTQPDKAEPELDVWRFMIDARFQGKGYGKSALKQVVTMVQEKGCYSKVQLSYVPGNDSAVELYKSVGFFETGEIDDGEVVMALP